jgi:radical SAM protein with 4Fe4S-binding SPASM domain
VDLCFSQAAPGLSAVLLRPAVIEPLATAKLHPGLALAYRPDQPRRDPIASEACVPLPAVLARTTCRFTLDSSRQLARLDEATAPLNGELPKVPALRLLEAVSGVERVDKLPREVVVELNVDRATRPIFWPGEILNIRRGPMPAAMARSIFEELAAEDDMRLVLGGLGDPMLRADIFEIVESARQAGIGRIAVETDFVGISTEVATKLAESAVDVMSMCLPATSGTTYAAIMGSDRLDECLGNLKVFLDRRASLGKGTPLVAPVFVKCQANLGEMEAWYDHWLKVLGSAVIVGPSDFGRRIADVGAADMSPPKRVGCRRLAGRMVVLCDGRVVACEEDVTGELAGGTVGERSMSDIWTKGLDDIRQLHRTGCWNNRKPCANCRVWHRP